MPVFFRWGALYKLRSGAKLQSRIQMGKQWWFTNHFEVPVGDKIKLKVSDQVDVHAAFKDPKNLGYKMGFELEFKA
jgi:hypothetical protein